ncbi:hypothetical protein DL93DRAFT_939966 [Clavulina sp. PMI_390]|nr:hypothetical protein DL93DRAFT_939966 [Clavulina sp. PMI_390]
MDDANRDQRQPLSSDQFKEWATVPSPAPVSFSLEHVEAPALTGISSFSRPVPSDLTRQTLNDRNSDNSSARRRGRTTSMEDAESSHPRKRIHLKNSPSLAGGGQESLPQHSSIWHSGQAHPSVFQSQSQTYLPDHQPQGYTHATPYPIAPTVASSRVHGPTMQTLGMSGGSQSTSYTSSSSSLPTSHEIPSAHTFSNIRTSTLREAEPTAATSDCDPNTALLRSHSSVSETTRHANTTLGTSTLMARFGIPNPQALSQLPHSEAIKILNQIYIVRSLCLFPSSKCLISVFRTCKTTPLALLNIHMRFVFSKTAALMLVLSRLI